MKPVIKTLSQVIVLIFSFIFINLIASQWFFRLDLTSEKRHTLSSTSVRLLEELPSEVYVKVYLYGDLNVGFQKLSRASREMLEEFKNVAVKDFEFEFVNPNNGDAEEKKGLLAELRKYGFEAPEKMNNSLHMAVIV